MRKHLKYILLIIALLLLLIKTAGDLYDAFIMKQAQYKERSGVFRYTTIKAGDCKLPASTDYSMRAPIVECPGKDHTLAGANQKEEVFF